MSPVTGDLLSAASFLAAVVGFLYTAWYPEISKAAEATSEIKNNQMIADVKATLCTRAVPLAVVAVGLVAVLVPTAVNVVGRVVKHFVHSTAGAYDPVQACYVAVVLVLLVIAATSVVAAVRVWKAWGGLKGKPLS